MMPRHVRTGLVMLDLFHRDRNEAGDWLGLHSREFELLWRMAESPRQRLSRSQLLAEVWRIVQDPETNRVEVHVVRVRAKFHVYGLSWLIATDPAGGYLLDAGAAAILKGGALMQDEGRDPQQYLDSYLRIGNDETLNARTGVADAISTERPRIHHDGRSRRSAGATGPS